MFVTQSDQSKPPVAKASITRIAISVAAILPLLIPKVFISVVNALTATANWVSSIIGWDWHRISPFYTSAWDARFQQPSRISTEVWIVLAVVIVDVLALLVVKRKAALRAANAAVLVFFAIAALVRLQLLTWLFT